MTTQGVGSKIDFKIARNLSNVTTLLPPKIRGKRRVKTVKFFSSNLLTPPNIVVPMISR